MDDTESTDEDGELLDVDIRIIQQPRDDRVKFTVDRNFMASVLEEDALYRQQKEWPLISYTIEGYGVSLPSRFYERRFVHSAHTVLLLSRTQRYSRHIAHISTSAVQRSENHHGFRKWQSGVGRWCRL